MSFNAARTEAWRDGLTQDELELVTRLEGMPEQMRLGYAVVFLMREITDLRRPAWRQALGPLTAIAAALGAFVAGVTGHDPRSLGG